MVASTWVLGKKVHDAAELIAANKAMPSMPGKNGKPYWTCPCCAPSQFKRLDVRTNRIVEVDEPGVLRCEAAV